MKALKIRQLHKTYGNGLHALRGIDLDVEQGDFFALLGANGAGKSTTIGIIVSLITKTGGTIEVFGHDVDRDFASAKSYIGLVPQEFNFNIFETCEQILMNQAGYYGMRKSEAKLQAEKYLKQLELWDKRHSLARELSGGMKRRLMIARALLHEPKLLILDEPTAGVDIEIRRAMWDFLTEINRQGTTIILTTHYLEEAENLCRNIAIIDHGNIIENTSMRQLISQLHMETFVFNLAQPLQYAPELVGCESRLIDDTTLEIDVDKQQSLNKLFAHLSDANIDVLSMKNKANRLEELFLGLITKK